MSLSPHKYSGFTLLELLFAMTLMALVAGTLYSSLYIASKAHNSATEALEAPRTAALALELLAQDFDAALPPVGLLAASFVGTDGSGVGNSDSLVFFSCGHAPKEGEVASDIRRIQLSVEVLPTETQPVLIRRLTTNLLSSQTPPVLEQVLCRRVTYFNLRYFDGSLWQDTWDSTTNNNMLPMAIEVTLEFKLDSHPGQADRTYRILRVFHVECGRNILDSSN